MNHVFFELIKHFTFMISLLETAAVNENTYFKTATQRKLIIDTVT